MPTPAGQRFGSVHGPSSPGIEPAYRNVAAVLVDGVDVLKRCYAASEPGGFADCYKVDGKGHPYAWMVRNGEQKLARERLFGVVEMRLKWESP